MSEKRPPDEIDGDFRSLTLSLSTPLAPLLKPEDKVPVKKWVRENPFDVADWGDREPKYEGGALFPGGSTVADRRKPKPRYSGALFPRAQLPDQRTTP